MSRLLIALLTFVAATSAAAQAACSSDGVPQPVAVLERFVNADCDACWRDAAAPQPGRGEIALDWIVPGAKGDDAPLSMGATRDALERLQALHRAVPERLDAVRTKRQGPARALRVAHGQAFNDYVGASIELKRGGKAGWDAWLLLVEQLPQGAEGSPVPRNLVRNAFRPDWPGPAAQRYEARAMQIAEGAKVDHLRLVGLLFDARGRLAAATISACR